MFSESKHRSKRCVPLVSAGQCMLWRKRKGSILETRVVRCCSETFLWCCSPFMSYATRTSRIFTPQLEADGTADGDRAPRPTRRHSAKQHQPLPNRRKRRKGYSRIEQGYFVPNPLLSCQQQEFIKNTSASHQPSMSGNPPMGQRGRSTFKASHHRLSQQLTRNECVNPCSQPI